MTTIVSQEMRDWLIIIPPTYVSDPLWDGSGCTSGNGCCAQMGMPWFYRKLPVHVAEEFEVRMCQDQSHIYGDEDIAVEKLELYVIQ